MRGVHGMWQRVGVCTDALRPRAHSAMRGVDASSMRLVVWRMVWHDGLRQHARRPCGAWCDATASAGPGAAVGGRE